MNGNAFVFLSPGDGISCCGERNYKTLRPAGLDAFHILFLVSNGISVFAALLLGDTVFIFSLNSISHYRVEH